MSDFQLGRILEQEVILPFSDQPKPEKNYKKNLSKIDKEFMMNQETHELVLETIGKLEEKAKSKNDLDALWYETKQIILSEIDKLPNITSGHHKRNKKFSKGKAFWNEELQALWNISCKSEKAYLNFKVRSPADNPVKNRLRLQFKYNQKYFDKKYRFFKRQHNKNEMKNLELNARSDPSAMWASLKRLNDPPKIKAALEIVREDKSISQDIKEVLSRWYSDISSLFSGMKNDPDVVFDDEFYNKIVDQKNQFELLSEQDVVRDELDYGNINDEITYDEVSAAVDDSKCKKAYLTIPNEALKNVNAKLLLAKFFNLCFMSGINPTDWDDSDIVPIPKKDKDERDPLQNRCITIVCCVAKIYSYILNKRLQTFLEKNKILAEEQNGFRIGRSCIDHLYIMCTVLRNRKAMGKETFLCFIDYKKAFDSVNRNMMMFKLSRVGINGHMYNAISSLYSNPRSRVLLQGY